MPTSDTKPGAEATGAEHGNPLQRVGSDQFAGSDSAARAGSAVGATRWPSGGGTFVAGVNLPWVRYGSDIGANQWSPEGGVGQAEGRRGLDQMCARVAAAGFTAVRWFLVCDGRAGVRVDDHGRPVGLDHCALRDLDAAVSALERHGLRAIFVLFDFLLSRPARWVSGVQLFGRRAWVTSDEQRQRLIDLVVAPLVEPFSTADAVLAWEVMNEPERATFGSECWAPWRAVTPATMRRFLRECVVGLRAQTRQPLTVGLASLRGLGLVRGLELDVYQVHWYDHVAPAAALTTPVAELGLDAPLLLGEYPSRGGSLRPEAILETAERAGYAGAFAWSFCAEDRFSSASACEGAVAGWRQGRDHGARA